MNPKKLLSLLTAGVLLCVMAACSDGAPSPAASAPAGHTHAPSGGWKADSKDHWQLCECGAQMNFGPHTLDENSFCTGCGAEIWNFDSLVDLYFYNDRGDMIGATTFDTDNSVISDMQMIYEYGQDDLYNRILYYENGVLVADTLYGRTADGEVYETKHTGYYEDGSYFINEYNTDSYITYDGSFDADGKLTSESHYEYSVSDEGEVYESAATIIHYENDLRFVCQYNQHGDILTRERYDLAENLIYTERYEQDYNDEGQLLWQKSYRDDRLLREILSYAEGSDEYGSWRYPEVTVDYNEDGSKVMTTFGPNTEPAIAVEYDADGQLVRTLTYEYTTDDAGNWKDIKVFDGGRLATHKQFALDKDGWSYLATLTEFAADGSKVVCKYDENEELISQIAYDPSGKAL